jgi:hypothetical protein
VFLCNLPQYSHNQALLQLSTKVYYQCCGNGKHVYRFAHFWQVPKLTAVSSHSMVVYSEESFIIASSFADLPSALLLVQPATINPQKKYAIQTLFHNRGKCTCFIICCFLI